MNAITVQRVRHNLFVAGKELFISQAVKEGANTTDSREPPEAVRLMRFALDNETSDRHGPSVIKPSQPMSTAHPSVWGGVKLP